MNEGKKICLGVNSPTAKEEQPSHTTAAENPTQRRPCTLQGKLKSAPAVYVSCGLFSNVHVSAHIHKHVGAVLFCVCVIFTVDDVTLGRRAFSVHTRVGSDIFLSLCGCTPADEIQLRCHRILCCLYNNLSLYDLDAFDGSERATSCPWASFAGSASPGTILAAVHSDTDITSAIALLVKRAKCDRNVASPGATSGDSVSHDDIIGVHASKSIAGLLAKQTKGDLDLVLLIGILLISEKQWGSKCRLFQASFRRTSKVAKTTEETKREM